MAFGSGSPWTDAGRREPGLAAVVRLAIGICGLATCITLLFLGMRAVMDVGGMCAEGGPYVVATSCPEGSVAATVLGVFGLFLFGGIAMWGGTGVGGAWTGVAGLAWVGLFAVLGWNFLEYGLVRPPEGGTVVWGWLIPGILFEAMAFGPVVLVAWGLRASRAAGGGVGAGAMPVVARPLAGPGQPGRRIAVSRPGPAEPPEGTSALLDRLERLADMRDRGLLRPEEYEIAKAAVLRDLDDRS